MNVKEQTCMLLIVTQCGGGYCTKLLLIPFATKKGLSIYVSVVCVASRPGKIRFSGEQKSVLLKASSGERGAPQSKFGRRWCASKQVRENVVRLKASSGERGAPRNFVLLLILFASPCISPCTK